MNKFISVLLALTVLMFISANAILLFGEKSIFPKRLYVHDYEQTFADSYTKELPKEALTAPSEEVAVYAPGEGSVDQWLVQEGDRVELGAELASLNGQETEDRREMWEAERTALQAEQREVQATLRDLEAARARGTTTSRSSESRTSNPANTDTNLNVDVEVEVSQDGAYAAGIAQAEQQLAALDRQLEVLDAQLAQNRTNPALLSPLSGTVASINKDGEPLSITLYPDDRVFKTFVTEEEWPELGVGDRATVYAAGMEEAIPASVTKVSEVPAGGSKWLQAYRALQPEDVANPLALYEVELAAEEPAMLPFGSTANASIVLDEAPSAVALHERWLLERIGQNGLLQVLNADGTHAEQPVTIAFDLNGQAVLADGIEPGTVVLNEEQLREEPGARLFMPFPFEQPNWYQAKNIYWKDYILYMLSE